MYTPKVAYIFAQSGIELLRFLNCVCVVVFLSSSPCLPGLMSLLRIVAVQRFFLASVVDNVR